MNAAITFTVHLAMVLSVPVIAAVLTDSALRWLDAHRRLSGHISDREGAE